MKTPNAGDFDVLDSRKILAADLRSAEREGVASEIKEGKTLWICCRSSQREFIAVGRLACLSGELTGRQCESRDRDIREETSWKLSAGFVAEIADISCIQRSSSGTFSLLIDGSLNLVKILATTMRLQ